MPQPALQMAGLAHMSGWAQALHLIASAHKSEPLLPLSLALRYSRWAQSRAWVLPVQPRALLMARLTAPAWGLLHKQVLPSVRALQTWELHWELLLLEQGCKQAPPWGPGWRMSELRSVPLTERRLAAQLRVWARGLEVRLVLQEVPLVEAQRHMLVRRLAKADMLPGPMLKAQRRMLGQA